METYWISGVQLGILKALVSTEVDDLHEEVIKLIDDIIENQQTIDEVRKK